MKKILFMSIILVIIFIIYVSNQDKKVYYLSLGDEGTGYAEYISDYLSDKKILEKMVDSFNRDNMRVIDLKNMIEDNMEINKVALQNALIKADLVTLSIGNNDLYLKFIMYKKYSEDEIYDYIDEYIKDLDILLSILRDYCKEKIMFIGYYNFFKNEELDKYYKYLIKLVMNVTSKYGIDYIDIYDEINNNYISDNYELSDDGYKFISDKVVKRLVK